MEMSIRRGAIRRRPEKAAVLPKKHRQKCHKFNHWPVLLREAMRMSDDENRYEGIPAHTDDYYEAIAMQEEIYLEEVEENLRAILASYKPSASRGGATNQRAAESLSQQLDRAAEELITGD